MLFQFMSWLFIGHFAQLGLRFFAIFHWFCSGSILRLTPEPQFDQCLPWEGPQKAPCCSGWRQNPVTQPRLLPHHPGASLPSSLHSTTTRVPAPGPLLELLRPQPPPMETSPARTWLTAGTAKLSGRPRGLSAQGPGALTLSPGRLPSSGVPRCREGLAGQGSVSSEIQDTTSHRSHPRAQFEGPGC